MRLLDGVGLAALAGAALAFAFGDSALSEAEDLRAIYWLLVGIVALRASVAFVRPGGARV